MFLVLHEPVRPGGRIDLATEPEELDLYEAKPSYRWLALVAALMAWGFDGVEQQVYAIMTRRALKDLIPGLAAMPANEIDGVIGYYFGLAMAMWLWGAAVGGVVFGRLGDRWGRVKALLLAVTIYAVCTGLSALTTHWSQLIALRFLGALGLGGTWPLCVAIVVETWPENRRAVLAGAIGAAANVGFLIAATFSRLMLAYGSSWRWVIGMGFFIGIASLPVIALVPEPTKWKRARQKNLKSSLGDLFTRRYRRSTIVGSLLATVALLGAWGAFLWLAACVDSLTEGMKSQDTAKAIAAQWASCGQILGGFLGGVLAGWLGNRKSWVLLCATAWVSVCALFLMAHSFDMRLCLMGAVAGFFVTAFFGWLPKYLPELYPTRIRATGQGFSYNIGRVLAGVGVLGTGAMVNFFHGDYRKGAMVMATVYLVGLVVIWFAPDTGGKMLADDAETSTQTGQNPGSNTDHE